MPKNPTVHLAALAALALSGWLVFGTWKNGNLQRGIQARQDRILAIQSEIQGLQQQLQAQQQSIEAATQLANQAGPAILNELATLQVKNGNIALGVLLQKHGVETRPQPASEPKTPRGVR